MEMSEVLDRPYEVKQCIVGNSRGLTAELLAAMRRLLVTLGGIN